MGRNSNSYVRILVYPFDSFNDRWSSRASRGTQRAKYANLPATHDFIPLAIESLGPISITGMDFLQDLGQRMTEATGDPRETTYLFQRLSICAQRFNAVAFRGSFDQPTTDENL